METISSAPPKFGKDPFWQYAVNDVAWSDSDGEMMIKFFLERRWYGGKLKLPWELNQHQDLVQESKLPRKQKKKNAHATSSSKEKGKRKETGGARRHMAIRFIIIIIKFESCAIWLETWRIDFSIKTIFVLYCHVLCDV